MFTAAPSPSTRYVDRLGWLRNRRAVLVDDHGLTIERWWGQPVTVAWEDVTGVTWPRRNRAVIGTLAGPLRIDHGLHDFAELMRLVQADTQPVAAMRAADGYTPDDIERWLNGFGRAEAWLLDTVPTQIPGLLVGLALAALLPVWAYAAWRVFQAFGPHSHWTEDPVLPATFLGAMVLWLPSSGWAASAVHTAYLRRVARRGHGRPGLARHVLRADADGGSYDSPDGHCDFRWTDVHAVSLLRSRVVLHQTGGRSVVIARYPQFEPVTTVARNLTLINHPVEVDAEPLPVGALSRAVGPSDGNAAERGLSLSDRP